MPKRSPGFSICVRVRLLLSHNLGLLPKDLMPQFTIYSAINPFGRVMQVWAKPDHMFPELIATDYPDPDTCTTHMIVSTPSFSLASRCFGIQSKLLTDHCVALGNSIHTINSELED